MISGALLRQTWRDQRVRVAVVAIALALWSGLMPVIYQAFGRQLEAILASGIVPDAFLRLLGADPFSLRGAVALGTTHPIAIVLTMIYPVGFATAVIAGERQRGTLEVLLSRPVSRRTVFATLLVAIVGIAALTVAAQVVGTVVSAAANGLSGGLGAGDLAFLALNTLLLLTALAAVSLAASASFDRLAPALGIGLAIVLVGYFIEIVGTLWPDAAFLQPLSPFHYLKPLEVLAGRGQPADLAVLAVIALVAAGFGLWHFPRRDLAAPS